MASKLSQFGSEVAGRFASDLEQILAGGLLVLVIDVAISSLSEPAALLAMHRYAAPLLLAGVILTALVSVPLTLATRRRWQQGAERPGWGWLTFAFAVVAASVTLTRFTLTASLQLPWDGALVVGSAVGAALVIAALLCRRRAPPTALLVGAIGYGAWLLSGAGRQVAPQWLFVGSFGVWGLASMLTLPRRRWLALACAGLSVLGLISYGADHESSSLIARRSVISGPVSGVLRSVIDLDSDGWSAFLGGRDCDDFDSFISPAALELVGNGVDDNCMGGDLAIAEVPAETTIEPARFDRMPPDVWLITLDAVRPDYVTAALMPHVHRLMSEGLRGAVAYTNAPYTGDAVLGAMTSTPVIDHRARGRFFGYEPSLAQVLAASGYQSVAVHCLADLAANLVQGFSLVDNVLGPHCRNFPRVVSDAQAGRALEHLKARDPSRPMLMWVHFTDPHLPYIGGYDAELRRTDEAVGRLLAARSRPTIVVVFSDHGESFGLHGRRGHIWRLDEELLRVVLAFHGPGVPRREVAWPVSLMDLAPTVANLIGVPPPAGWQGASLLADPGDRALVFESSYHDLIDLRGIRRGRYKITLDQRRGTFELYDVVADPDDLVNLVGSHPEVFADMHQALGRTFDQLHNNRRLSRKLRLLRGRPVVVPRHLGPLEPGQAQ